MLVFRMAYRVATGAVLLALTGCFSEPPSSLSSSGVTSDPPTGSSSTQAEDETSTGFLGSSSGLVCFLDDAVEPPLVGADIIVVLDVGVALDGLATGMIVDALEGPGTNVSVFSPVPAEDLLPLDFDCSEGCGNCDGLAQRVAFLYEGSPLVAVENAFLNGELSCVLRPPPAGGQHSGPARQLWFITESPGTDLEGNLSTLVTKEQLRVHLACPGCDSDLDGVADMLGNAVERTRGTVANSNLPGLVAGQALGMASERYSCLWPDAGSPLDIEVVSESVTGEVETALFYPGESLGDCEGMEGGVGFYEIDGGLQMCPFACSILQARNAMNTTLTVCE